MVSSKPARMAATEPPWPSTTALVASVVDTETRPMRRAASLEGRRSSTRPMASATPMARLPRVVSALAEATTAWVEPEMITASV